MKNNKLEILGIIAVILVLLFMLTSLNGCSTVAGVGKDITGAADWTKEKIVQPEQSTKPSKADK